MKRSVIRAGRFLAMSIVFILATGFSASAFAQGFQSSSPVAYVVLLAFLGLLPFLLVMVTSFVKVAVVLSLLRMAIGVQQVPPNQVINGLAIVLSIYIMAPVGYEVFDAVEPSIEALSLIHI